MVYVLKRKENDTITYRCLDIYIDSCPLNRSEYFLERVNGNESNLLVSYTLAIRGINYLNFSAKLIIIELSKYFETTS